ncbi:hypothetical protein NPS01_32450 [Nocardioides psychrotolerans]|uniref:Ig-like domain-containing protein n=1 Tax=Nocardioides psychrotolerans TaxID=1005945 RepID=A0A1I3NYB0_9ACTN|nr:hypothetical protein [Nocardioides psychrotolerans]GEP39582.1 hypothetical protein NPS01_32450 [Nocardioides psychrotolerans]SFJ14275.1 hypothetical protein SAMN05216561_11929 [Nocardioides psychrotolerans]
MNRSEIARRAVSLTLGVLCLLMAPQIAHAAFTARQAPIFAVGTAKLVAPTSMTGTFSCSRTTLTESATVSVTGFTDAGPAGSSYVYRLSATGAPEATATSTTRTASLTGSRARDNAATTWTLTIGATIRSWTGPLLTATFTCKATGNDSGSL